VRMIERREDSRFALESSHAFRIEGKRFGQDFDRDDAAQLGIARAIDLAHPARAEGADDFIRTETSTADHHEDSAMDAEVSDVILAAVCRLTV